MSMDRSEPHVLPKSEQAVFEPRDIRLNTLVKRLFAVGEQWHRYVRVGL